MKKLILLLFIPLVSFGQTNDRIIWNNNLDDSLTVNQLRNSNMSEYSEITREMSLSDSVYKPSIFTKYRGVSNFKSEIKKDFKWESEKKNYYAFNKEPDKTVTFRDGQTLPISKLFQDLIDVTGESNLLVSKSSIDKFNKCLFENIAKNSSYARYREDLLKSKNHSDNKEKRMYYLYSVPYINTALWGCVESDNNFINEFAKIDKIIPQSDEKIEMIGLELLKDFKREMGIFEYNEAGKYIDWKAFSECYARKLWARFTPKEMMNPTKESELIVDEFMNDCMEQNSNLKELNKKNDSDKYGSDFAADESLLGDYVSFINNYKSKGLNFKIKSPIGFINTFANSPNIIRLWRKENASKNDDPWIYILILKEKMYEDEKEFKKELINGGAIYLANQLAPNSTNAHYFSAGNYPGIIFDMNPTNGEKITTINLYLQNHLVQFWYASRAKLNKNEFDRYRNILIAFAKSIKFL